MLSRGLRFYIGRLMLVIWVTFSVMVTKGCLDRDNDLNEIRIAVFEADATPDIGLPLAYDPTLRIEMPLSARGVVLIGNGDPVVLCAVDWIGIGNTAYDAWREALAEAAGTTPDRVTVHSLHQHDAPMADYNAYDILTEFGIDPSGTRFDNREFVQQTIDRVADAIRESVEFDLRSVTHVGTGTGTVEKVASNRRLIDREGTVHLGRMSSTRNVEAQRAPVGTIDPDVRMLSFWNEEEPLAVLTYYASHPQSYYRTGGANPDFPGIARAIREKETGIRHIHFTGAGGNIAAGKWNDGWTEKRQILADRLKAGFDEAWEQTKRSPVSADQLEWRIEPVALPPGEHLDEQALEQTLAEAAELGETPTGAARQLGWLRRTLEGDNIALTALRIGPARILHTPAELAVEYQLNAQSLYPDDFIANASYSDYDPGYISTEIHYQQGGYEASNRASRVAPEVEHVMLSGIRRVLAFEAFRPDPATTTSNGYRLERSAVQFGYDGEYSWINGRAGVIPAHVSINPINKPTVVLSLHQVEHSGPDIFQGLHYFRSRDLGLSWEGPFQEPVFQRVPLSGEEDKHRLVSDFTPKFHTATETLLGIGHTSVYERNRVVPGEPHDIAYAAFDEPTQTWSEWQILELPNEPQFTNAGAGSGRRVDLAGESVLFPVYFNDPEGGQFHVTVIHSSFDGETLEYKEHGNIITVAAGERLHEPSLTVYDGNYYLTFRNDEEMYVARSSDGLHFNEPQLLRFDNDRNLVDEKTKQHWLTHRNGLFLAYTRQGSESLYLARVDADNLHIIGQTEQIIIPTLRGGRLDNLDVTDISEDETWVIATELVQPTVAGAEYAPDNLIHVARLNWLVDM